MKNECHVYLYQIDYITLHTLNFIIFPISVAKYLETKRNSPKYYQSLYVWAKFCAVLKNEYKYDLNKLVFHLEDGKKPQIDGINFSITHSNNLVAFCIGDTSCGIDIELCKERDYHKLTNRLCKNENLSVNTLKEFYEFWCYRECLIKLGDIEKVGSVSKYYKYLTDRDNNLYLLCVVTDDMVMFKNCIFE